MERRYLVATLALAATFAVFSQGLNSGYLAKVPRSRAELMADVTCAKHYVAEQLVARLEPLLDRTTPEQAQMVAELNLPEVVRMERSDAQSQVMLAQRHVAEQKCAAAMRIQRQAMRLQARAMAIRIHNAEQAQRIQELAVVRAEQLSERAQQINLTVARAQELSSKSMARAQCALDQPRAKLNRWQTQGTPIHISFQVPATPKINMVLPAVPQPPAPASF
jgi:hypothetical protein